MASISKGSTRGVVTKAGKVSTPPYILMDDIMTPFKAAVDNVKLGLAEHVLNENVHLTQEEKDKLKDMVENGAGIRPEDWEFILEELSKKADIDHTHSDDEDFYILASQVTETTDRKFVSKSEKDALSGVKGNIQTQINILNLLCEEVGEQVDSINDETKKQIDSVKKDTEDKISELEKVANGAMRFSGRYNSYADMIEANPNPTKGATAFVDNDETQENSSTIYYHNGSSWTRIKKDKKSESGWIATTKAPTDTNLLWLDISSVDPIIKWYDGSQWIIVSGASKKEILASMITQETDLNFVDDRAIGILSKLYEDADTGFLMYDGIILGGGSADSGASIDDSNISLDTTYSSFKINEEIKNKQDKLGFMPENTSNKGKANGYASLDSEAKVPRQNLYDSTFVVPDEERRLQIVGAVDGDTCYEESTTKYFVFSSGQWKLVSKGDSIVIGRNNFEGDRNPTNDDDETAGYLPGSIWINTYTKKAYICTDSTDGASQWEQMAGQITLNIGEIIPFVVDKDAMTEIEAGFAYEIPAFNPLEDFIEVTKNGLEIARDVAYEVLSNEDKSYLVFKEQLTEDDSVFGEIYKHDNKLAEEQMLKSVYDSNHNGKVDIAEMAELSKTIQEWAPSTKYEAGHLCTHNGSLYICTTKHLSAGSIDSAKWNLVYARLRNLSDFDTDDLTPTTNRQYVNSTEKSNIGQLPGVFSTVNSLSRQVPINTSDISSLKGQTATLKNRLDDIRFTTLKDTPSSLSAGAYIKVNSDGTALTQIKNPTFPIKSIIDCNGNKYNKIDTPKFNHLEVTDVNGETGVYTLELSANATELKDMPSIHEHGKVLVSDVNNQKFVLADKEDLTMSIENFSKTIARKDWEKNEVEDRYEYVIFHDMSSEALVVSFIDYNKAEAKDITYEIIDKSSIRVISQNNEDITCTINCSLGAGNGYWQYLMDWSKIQFVDDAKLRTDRAYSSSKMMNILSSYCLKSDYYTRQVSDSRYGRIEKEHEHKNSNYLDKIGENEDGDMTYNGVRLLTEMKPTTIELDEIIEQKELEEVYVMGELCDSYELQALIASEILIQNVGTEESIVKIMDGSIDVVSIRMQPNEVQKYHLGISKKTKILVKGKARIMFTATGF